MDVLHLPIKLWRQSLSTVIYVSVIDFSSSELHIGFSAHGIFGFKIYICMCVCVNIHNSPSLSYEVEQLQQ